MTWKLEKALGGIPYDHFDISEEVQEQVGVEKSMLLSYQLDLHLIFFCLLGGVGEITAEKSLREIWVFQFKNVISCLSPAAG